MAANSAGFTFEREISAGGKLYGMHIHKIPTPRYGAGLYDFLVVWKGMPIAIECKATRTEASFPFDRVEAWQVEAMQDMHDNGGKAYVLINVRKGRAQVAYILSIKEYVRLKELYNTLGRKSIPLAALKMLPQLNRLNKPAGWDIRPLFTEETYNETTNTTDASSGNTTSNSKRANKVHNVKESESKDV